MNLKALQTFYLIVREGSLAAAALKLNLSQPAVSRLVRVLEDETRLTLFSRSRRRLVLTREGEMFFREAHYILQGVDEIPRIARDIRKKAIAHLRIVTGPPIGVSLVAPAVARLKEKHPDVHCVTDIGSRFELESMVGTRHYDLGIVSLPISHSLVQLQTKTLCRARLVALIPAANPLSEAARLTAADLKSEPLITLRPGQLWRDRADDFFRAGAVTPEYGIETRSTLMASALVASGAGIAVMDKVVGGLGLTQGTVAVPLAPERWVEYGIVMPTGQVLHESARAFVETLYETIGLMAAADGKPALVQLVEPVAAG
ncbi:MAG: LysR family transcriptional regulator [Burkholderiaceae bacterium]